ncbi:MAG TPA: vitamin K epoxide reductase family protein [Candidatus Paceibacterota bacterium]|nr:vitamin K epoxide reductase family protein [Candidatus Paceibacterota bacterium]
MKRASVVLILVLAFCGLADSAYLAQNETAGTPLLCNIQYLSGCNTVAASPYSRLFGIPLADYGVLFYSIIFALAALELFVYDRRLRRTLQGVAILGLVVSLYFTLIEVFAIQAYCIYCLASALIALIIFVLAGFIEPLRRPAPEALPPSLSMPPAA